jgi:hypothetical protein
MMAAVPSVIFCGRSLAGPQRPRRFNHAGLLRLLSDRETRPVSLSAFSPA